MKMLFSSQNGPEVGLLKGVLEEAGIQCEVRNESISANLPGAAFQPEIWILNDADFDRACGVLDGWQLSPRSQPTERVERESPVGALRFVGLVCLAACAFMIWLAIRANDWARPTGAAALFGVLGVVTLVAAGQLRPWRRKRTAKRS